MRQGLPFDPLQSQAFGRPSGWSDHAPPAKQVAAGLEGASAGANHLTANAFDLLDKAAENIASTTGTTKGGAFKQVADWARGDQAAQEREARRLSPVARTDLPSRCYQGVLEGVASVPTAGVAAGLGGPVAGFAALGALQESDKGWLRH